MEDHRNGLVLILAGYKDEMEWFLRQNPGLRSRLPIQLDFPDYTADQLIRIAEHMVRERDYRLAEDARQKLLRSFLLQENRFALRSGNARLVRNLVEKAIRRQARRIVRERLCRREDLMMLKSGDFDLTLSQPGTGLSHSGGDPSLDGIMADYLLARRANGRKESVPAPAGPANGGCGRGQVAYP